MLELKQLCRRHVRVQISNEKVVVHFLLHTHVRRLFQLWSLYLVWVRQMRMRWLGQRDRSKHFDRFGWCVLSGQCRFQDAKTGNEDEFGGELSLPLKTPTRAFSVITYMLEGCYKRPWFFTRVSLV